MPLHTVATGLQTTWLGTRLAPAQACSSHCFHCAPPQSFPAIVSWSKRPSQQPRQGQAPPVPCPVSQKGTEQDISVGSVRTDPSPPLSPTAPQRPGRLGLGGCSLIYHPSDGDNLPNVSNPLFEPGSPFLPAEHACFSQPLPIYLAFHPIIRFVSYLWTLPSFSITFSKC